MRRRCGLGRSASALFGLLALWTPSSTSRMPKLTVRGANPTKVGLYTVGHDYHDRGADCSDRFPADGNLDRNIAVGGDFVDLTKAGQYQVRYYCDADGLVVNTTRTVLVSPKFNPGCEKVRVAGDAASDLSQMGSYDLMEGVLNDGKPVYRQVDGCRCNHIYFMADEDAKSHVWFIEPFKMSRVRSMDAAITKDSEKAGLHVINDVHEGLRAASWAPRPEDIRKTWKVWQATKGRFVDVPKVHVQCHEAATQHKKALQEQYRVRASVQIVGYTLASFSEQREYEFCAAIADAVDVPVEDVIIVEVVDDYHFGRRRRRRLLASDDGGGLAGEGGARARARARDAAASGGRSLGSMSGVRVLFEVKTPYHVVEQGVARKLHAERFEETLFEELARNSVRVPGMRIIVDQSSVHVDRPKHSGRGVLMVLGVVIGALAMAMGLMSGFVSCSSRRHKAKTFTEASCSTDDIDFDALNDAGELEVDIEETQAILGAGGADGGENYGGDDDDDDTL